MNVVTPPNRSEFVEGTPALHTASRAVETEAQCNEMSDREIMVMVYRQMRMLAGPHPDLDDLAQTALEQLLSARFDGRSSFKTFSHAICYRVWLKHLRWSYRFRARFLVGSENDDTPAPQADAQEQLEEHERFKRLYAILDQLPPKHRAVVALHDIGGVDVNSIAGIVDTKLNTVRSRLRDGRKKLCSLLHADPYFGDDPKGTTR